MTPKLRIAAITDEFSPLDLVGSLVSMKEIGMTGAELRMVFGKNIMDLDEDELKRAEDLLGEASLEVVAIASPLLKCVLTGGPAIDTRFEQDMFAARHTLEDQPRLAEHAMMLAQRFKAPVVRVFSYWRTVEPDAVFGRIAESLNWLGDLGRQAGVTIGLENEHACHVGTATEAAKMLEAVQHEFVKLVWDPANAMVAGEQPYPDGYNRLPKERVAHVHAKDCHLEGHTPVWGPLGTRHVDWQGQIGGLLHDGYAGYLSLETHWSGPLGDKKMASYICGWNLRGLASA